VYATVHRPSESSVQLAGVKLPSVLLEKLTAPPGRPFGPEWLSLTSTAQVASSVPVGVEEVQLTDTLVERFGPPDRDRTGAVARLVRRITAIGGRDGMRCKARLAV
jgi:hypothetical protein